MIIPAPSEKELLKYLKLWDSLDNYVSQESSLRKLFTKTYPKNDNLDEVLIKACSLNDFYSTNIFSPFIVAKHIIKQNIDNRLKAEDINIVNKLAYITMNKNRRINFYSFASKYCSHHKPTIYPIYDYFVEKMLMYFKKRDNFTKFKRGELKKYLRFKEILTDFQRFYKLNKFNLKQIDQYLWLAGKEYFPKSY